jgi:GntR family transcriptional regulator
MSSTVHGIGAHGDGVVRSIDKSSPIPYYYQLQGILKEEIEEGTWRTNDLLPSEGDLGKRFEVSRTVIRQALDVLQADGQITRSKGKRSIVCEPKFHWDATAGTRDWSHVETLTPVLVGRVIDQRRVPAGARIGSLLGIDETETIFELTFTQLIADRPTALSQMYLRPGASAALEDLVGKEDLTPILTERGADALRQLAERYDARASITQVTVETTTLNDFEAEVLLAERDGSAFLLATLDLDLEGAPIAFTRTVLRADLVWLSMTLRRDESLELDECQSIVPFIAQSHSDLGDSRLLDGTYHQ